MSRSPSPALVALLATGAGLSAAALYYNQPMLHVLARELATTPERVGYVPAATQLGYASGLVLSAPLGDTLDRRRVILTKAWLLAGMLVIAGLATNVVWLAVASLGVGLVGSMAQDLVPAAAALAEPAKRGKTVGTVMTGLLLGILLSRVVSGAVTQYVSWRAVFFGAAATVVGFAVVAGRVLPPFPSNLVGASYGALLRSMVALLRDVGPLRRAVVVQGLLSLTFSGFWSTLALGLAQPPFELSSLVAGSFGIAGAAGALIAPIAGGLSDRRGPIAVIRVGASIVVASFVAMAVFPGSLPLLVIATITFDLGIQACLIAHQTIIYAQDPAARSRLNAVLVSVMFFAMASGAFLASRIFARFGLPGVFVFCAALATSALVARLVLREPAKAST